MTADSPIRKRVRIEYFDQNDRFEACLPKTGTVVDRFSSLDGVDNWYLVDLDVGIDFEGERSEKLLIRSRWGGHEIGENEPTSVFLVLIPDKKLIQDQPLNMKKLMPHFVAWGMCHTLS